MWQGGVEYDTDSDGAFALSGDDGESFFLEDIGPDTTKEGTFVYDVPAKLLGENLRLRVNELGFGEAHAFISLGRLG